MTIPPTYFFDHSNTHPSRFQEVPRKLLKSLRFSSSGLEDGAWPYEEFVNTKREQQKSSSLCCGPQKAPTSAFRAVETFRVCLVACLESPALMPHCHMSYRTEEG